MVYRPGSGSGTPGRAQIGLEGRRRVERGGANPGGARDVRQSHLESTMLHCDRQGLKKLKTFIRSTKSRMRILSRCLGLPALHERHCFVNACLDGRCKAAFPHGDSREAIRVHTRLLHAILTSLLIY